MVKCRSLGPAGYLSFYHERLTGWESADQDSRSRSNCLLLNWMEQQQNQWTSYLLSSLTFRFPWGLFLLLPHRHRRPPRLQLVSAQLGRFSSSNDVSLTLRMRNLRGSQLQPNLQYINTETPMECLRRWGSPVQVSDNGRKREWNDDYDGPFKVGKVLPMFGQ